MTLRTAQHEPRRQADGFTCFGGDATPPLTVVAFLAGPSGVALLEHMLRSERYIVDVVFTHATIPTGPSKGQIRPELDTIAGLCRTAITPLLTGGGPYICGKNLDLVVSCSWRKKIPMWFINNTKHGGINLHRGDLPGYPGAEPVRRMIEAGEPEAVITAHKMTDVIDGGEILAKAKITMPLGGDAEHVKERILPLYVPLLETAVDSLTALPIRRSAPHP